MTTIKGIWLKTKKENLGTEKAEFIQVGNADQDTCTLIGLVGDTAVVLVRGTYYSMPETREVDWIGNKPKIKKLYALLIKTSCTEGQRGNEGRIVYQNKSACGDHLGDLGIKWLNEEQYPPIEVPDND